MERWLSNLRYNPITPLIESSDKPISLFAQCDLRGKTVSLQDLWQLPEPQKTLRKQESNGCWEYPAKQGKAAQKNFNQYETYKNLGMLVERFGFDKRHPAIQKTADYFFSVQSDEGDFRGIYDKQYSPNYTAGIAELLIKAGYKDDRRIERVFKWLLSIRQQDGGWALPFRTRGYNIDVSYSYPTTIRPDKSKPFSHMVTGVVLRAFAAHPSYKKSKEAKQAGKLLLNNLFKKDNYPDRGGSDYWLRFTVPFCYTDLISALDSLSLLGFSAREPQIEEALQWFVKNQQKNGLWIFKIVRGRNREILEMWLALAVCRIFKRFYD